MAARRFTDADLERWVRNGLLNAGQRDAILRDLEGQPAVEGGLHLTTLLYYGGGLLVLLAYSIFLGLQWEELNPAGRIAIAAASAGFFAVVSQLLLRSGRFQLPGELLQVVAVAIVPLLAFALLDAAGLWPDEPGYRPFGDEARRDYQADLAWARMALAGLTLVVAVAAFGWSRSPFVLVAAVVSFASLVVDASLQVQRPGTDYEWSATQALVIAALGAAVLAGGIASRERTERDYTTWLYVMGLTGLGVGLSSKAFPEDGGAGWGTLWLLVSLLVLALSIFLQQRLFAAAGLAAVFAYLGKLVFDVFESANAALVLIVLGLLILGLGMVYQRFGDRVFARPRPESS